MYLKIQVAQLVISVCALATLYWSMQIETECNVDTIVSDEMILKYKDL